MVLGASSEIPEGSLVPRAPDSCRQRSSSLHGKHAPSPKHLPLYSITPVRDRRPLKSLNKVKNSTHLSPWVHGATNLQPPPRAHVFSRGHPAVAGGQRGHHGRWLGRLPAAQGAELSGALPPSAPRSTGRAHLRNSCSLGKGKTRPDTRCLPRCTVHAESPTTFRCRRKLTLSLLQPNQKLCWCVHGPAQAQFVRPAVSQGARLRGSLGPGEQGQHAENQHLLQRPTSTPWPASWWPGEATRGGRRPTSASPSYPVVNIRSAASF